ncbi:MAG: monovalent cation/H(+) antiporter subunit G [Thermomicrobiales bacterium]|nr:monovalent cation/H(+) antiporter subunit G [Thermomicrobiales bacterium]
MTAAAPWVADALVVLGLLVMTAGVYGVVRMPDIYTKLHAASKSVFLGVCSLAVASFASGDPAIFARTTLIAILLILTTPVASHAIGAAAFRLREPMISPDAIDESEHLPRPLPAAAPSGGDGRAAAAGARISARSRPAVK